MAQHQLKLQGLQEVGGRVGRFLMGLYPAVITLLMINQCFQSSVVPVTALCFWLTGISEMKPGEFGLRAHLDPWSPFCASVGGVVPGYVWELSFQQGK